MLGPPKTSLAAGFFGNCTAFLPVQGPKSSCGQGVALGPSLAWGGPCATHQQATKSPQPPQPANVGPGAGIFGKCTAFFSLVLSCQVKNSWAGPDFSTCVVPLTPHRTARSFELPQVAKNGCCTCIWGHAWAVLPPPPLNMGPWWAACGATSWAYQKQTYGQNEPYIMLRYPY